VFSGARPLHGVLGAFCPLAGNLQGPWTDFWNRVIDQNLSILTSYALAMELGHSEGPQPYAAIWITGMNYNKDKMKTMQRDLTPALVTTFSYITLASLGNPVCGRGAEPIEMWKEGVAVQAAIKNIADFSQAFPRSVSLVPVQPDFDPGFVGERRVRPDGSTEIGSEQFYTDTQKASSLGTKQLEDLGNGWIRRALPKYSSVLRLRSVDPVTYEESDIQGRTKEQRVVGHVLTFSQEASGLPLLFHNVRLRIIGDDIVACYMKLADQQENGKAANESERYLSAQNAFERALPQIRGGIERATGELFVLSGEPAYWMGAESANRVTIGQPYISKLVYRFLVTDRNCETLPCTRRMWWVIVNAIDGSLEDVTKY